MAITAASPSPVAKRELTRELLEPTFQLRDPATSASSEANSMIGDAAATCSSASSSSPATPSSTSSLSELAGAAAFPSKRSNWTRRLVITKQPLSEFYKDEGGKANALEVEVTLVEFNELGEPARSPDEEFIAIPLRILLFFESGKRVDDTDQEIFRFVGNDYDSVVIRAPTRKAAVQFRLEKVSRRKDGQRFKLRIEVDQEQCTANVADLTPIFTNAICVLSKRKHHSSYASDTSVRVKEPPPKLLKRGGPLLCFAEGFLLLR
ncbi:hypothetical protein BBJ28_00020453 [Nothophytophthora sp. Chile5]|nr:hypothetical protein BBJ28_00020453 [Nothophytophthora sp. Chile5]